MQTKISFLGAAGNVTGSRTLLETQGMRILVDCGLHQERAFRARDFEDFPVPPESIDAVILTHAHLDHCGYLPRLVRKGFRGKIVATPATVAVSNIVLQDSARIQEEDIRYKRRRHRKRKKTSPFPYEPLYTVDDALKTLELFWPLPLMQAMELAPGITVTLRNSGHILGSSFARLVIGEGDDERAILFSGDVGRDHKPIIKDPVRFAVADYVIMESTYGDREHGEESTQIADHLEREINDTVRRGGNVLIPSFAVERAHEVLYHLNELMRAERIPPLVTFLDSPMALRVTEVFKNHPERYDEEMVQRVEGGQSPFDFHSLHLTPETQQSIAINNIRGTAIIIAGSGMCTGGRIKHHLRHNISRKNSTLLFVGYQAHGTLGRILLDRPETVRIFGQEYRVRARIDRIPGFSAHADRVEMTRWISTLERPPRRVFVNHGEADAASAFAAYLGEETGWDVVAPGYGDAFELD